MLGIESGNEHLLLNSLLFFGVVAKVAAGIVDEALDDADLGGRVGRFVSVFGQLLKYQGQNFVSLVKQDGIHRVQLKIVLSTQVLAVQSGQHHIFSPGALRKILSLLIILFLMLLLIFVFRFLVIFI